MLPWQKAWDCLWRRNLKRKMQVLYTGGVKSVSKKGVVLAGGSIQLVKWRLCKCKLYVIGLLNSTLLCNCKSLCKTKLNISIELLCNSDILQTLNYCVTLINSIIQYWIIIETIKHWRYPEWLYSFTMVNSMKIFQNKEPSHLWPTTEEVLTTNF